MKERSRDRLILAMLFVLYLIILPGRYFVYDFEFWTDWALYIHRHGITNIYDNPTTNYHPGFLYCLYLYDLLMGSEELIVKNINYIKYIPMVFDFLPIVVLCGFRQRLVELKIPYLFLLLNIAYMFNSMCWGQVDAIHTNLIFLSLLCAFYRPYWSVGLFMAAITFKLQAIVFIPILGIILLYSVRNAKRLISLAVFGAALLALFISPFLLSGNAGKLWYVVTHAVGFYPRVSICAFNLWTLLLHDTYNTMDYTEFFILSYKQTGLLLFLASSGLTLLPLLLRIVRHIKEKSPITHDTRQMLLLAAGMISLYFFYFNTQMHERYAHPIIIFFFFYGVYSKNYKLYILASIPYFLSLDKCFPDFLPVYHYKIIWAMKVIAIWYTLTLL
ncbi:MAG: hypothetical protein JNL72_00625 [Flavipsychrobacter sp.]|nr:hypothetical protein [Flavipsychrobacter sp.]